MTLRKTKKSSNTVIFASLLVLSVIVLGGLIPSVIAEHGKVGYSKDITPIDNTISFRDISNQNPQQEQNFVFPFQKIVSH